MQYNVTYACGHEGTVDIYGRSRDREWKLAHEEEKLCPDCWKKQRDEERAKQNAEAAEANKEAGLPELEGTEKQIAWAESIRKSMIDHIIEYYVSQITDEAKAEHPEEYERVMKAFEAIKQHTDASWWIDNRVNDDKIGLRRLINAEIEAIKKAEKEPPKAIIEAAKAEATVYPEKRVTDLVVEISVSDNEVSAYLPERSDVFREIVKGLDYGWGSGRWRKPIKVTNGPASDRAAELGNRLLAAGFPVRIYDPEIRQKAVSGEYEPECKRWVFVTNEKHKRPGHLAIWWSRQEGDFYDTAKRIAGAAWYRPYVIVPPENYEEVLDFARMYGFKVSAAAQRAIDAAKELKARALVPDVYTPDKPKEVIPSGKPPVLEVPDEVEIDEEFRDEN